MFDKNSSNDAAAFSWKKLETRCDSITHLTQKIQLQVLWGGGAFLP